MGVPIELDIEQAELIYVWIEKYKNIEDILIRRLIM